MEQKVKVPICPICKVRKMRYSQYSFTWYCDKCLNGDNKKEGDSYGYSY